MTRHRESSDSRSFGRTGPAEVRSCGCDVLPWEDCEHSAWDADKSLERVVQEAEAFMLTPPPSPPMAHERSFMDSHLAIRECERLANMVISRKRCTTGMRELARKVLDRVADFGEAHGRVA